MARRDNGNSQVLTCPKDARRRASRAYDKSDASEAARATSFVRRACCVQIDPLVDPAAIELHAHKGSRRRLPLRSVAGFRMTGEIECPVAHAAESSGLSIPMKSVSATALLGAMVAARLPLSLAVVPCPSPKIEYGAGAAGDQEAAARRTPAQQ